MTSERLRTIRNSTPSISTSTPRVLSLKTGSAFRTKSRVSATAKDIGRESSKQDSCPFPRGVDADSGSLIPHPLRPGGPRRRGRKLLGRNLMCSFEMNLRHLPQDFPPTALGKLPGYVF